MLPEFLDSIEVSLINSLHEILEVEETCLEFILVSTQHIVFVALEGTVMKCRVSIEPLYRFNDQVANEFEWTERERGKARGGDEERSPSGGAHPRCSQVGLGQGSARQEALVCTGPGAYYSPGAHKT